MIVRRAALVSTPLLLLALSPAVAQAEGPSPGYHPYASEHVGPRQLDARDLVSHPERYTQGRVPQRTSLQGLDDVMRSPTGDADASPREAGRTPDGWVQMGGVVMPAPVASGEVAVDPDVIEGMQVVPGNEYPRKHTLYLEFNGGMLYSGADNSAENKSTLARQGVYPTYEGGEQKALAIIENVQADVSNFGVLIKYGNERPNKTVPYTMEMMGGSWMDTNIDSPAGGVAPGADCGALGQRHVVYTFASGGTPATVAANTASQEAGHAWGLDHTLNCGSVMSYCGSGDGVFSDTCDTFCESQCQGPGSIGCRLTHEEFCGEGSERQNEQAELGWLFGGNEPDMEPPSVEIVSPEDGLQVDVGADIDIRSLISDNYGGYGWYYYITQNGEVVADFVDYERTVDNDYRPALNLAQLTEGTWEITVGAEDHYGHITEDTVTVIVGDGMIQPGDSGSGDGATMGEGGDETEGPAGTGDGGLDGSEVSDEGCSCRQGSSSGSAGGFAGLLLLGAVARRRRRR